MLATIKTPPTTSPHLIVLVQALIYFLPNPNNHIYLFHCSPSSLSPTLCFLIHQKSQNQTKVMAYMVFLCFLTIVSLLSSSTMITEAKVSAVIVFGDSSVDAGNNNFIPTIARSNFLPYGRDFAGGKATGRFSNGRIPTDFISEAFGLKPIVPAYLDPAYNISDLATGLTFASAGTGYDNATSDVLVIFDWFDNIFVHPFIFFLRRGKKIFNFIN